MIKFIRAIAQFIFSTLLVIILLLLLLIGVGLANLIFG